MVTGNLPLPEITLRSLSVVPPIVLLLEPLPRKMPCKELPNALLPLTSVPILLPAMMLLRALASRLIPAAS